MVIKQLRPQVEQELLELWSSVEKEKAAARERAHVARRAGKAQLRRLRGNEKARAHAHAAGSASCPGSQH